MFGSSFKPASKPFSSPLSSLFVFSINGPEQNARSLLTPVSDPAFYALSHGSKHFLLHGSSNNRLFQRFWLAVEEFWPIRKWLKKLPWRAKLRLPCERAWKAGSETGVKSDLAFCLGSLFKKTNRDWSYWISSQLTLGGCLCRFTGFFYLYQQNVFIKPLGPLRGIPAGHSKWTQWKTSLAVFLVPTILM